MQREFICINQDSVLIDAFNLDYASDIREMRRLLTVSGTTLPLKKITGVVKENILEDEGLAWTMDVLKENKDDE